MSHRSKKIALGTAVGVAGCSLSAVFLGAGTANATTTSKPVELQVENRTTESVHAAIARNEDSDRGSVRSQDINGIPALPASEFELAPKSSTDSYSMELLGKWNSFLEGNKAVKKLSYRNHFAIQASFDQGLSKSQAHFSHEGDTSLESESKKWPVSLSKESEDSDLVVSVEEKEDPAEGFAKKYKIVINERSAIESETPITVDVRKLTSSGRAVYKATIPERTKRLTSIPSSIKIKPYSILGRGLDPSSGQEIGQVLPVGEPTIDHTNKTLTIPKVDFHFEHPEGYYPNYFLTVKDGAVVSNSTDVTRAPGPPVDLDQGAITNISAAPATGQPVTPNGVAQEPLKLKLTAAGETVSPDHHPELNNLYDYVYFRDSSGKLITGMYEERTTGGYSTVTDAKGSYINKMVGIQQSSNDANRVYLSTTKGTPNTFRAHLNVSKSQQSPEVRVERGDIAETAQGNASQGFSLTRQIANPAGAGSFHHFNGEKPDSSLLTRYSALAVFSSLPQKNPYSGNLTLQNNAATARIDQLDLFDTTPHIQTQLINAEGTYVSVPMLAT
ncbi:hypothetical protein [Streptomyces cyaneofuscatus]|uniref:hypothetical protein n=1 Tax=Streptomyces cyaneofuscatus TaxID=66883 RepID=UPI0036466A37